MELFVEYLGFIFLFHLIIGIKDKTYRDYYVYWKTTNDTLIIYFSKLFLNYKYVYSGAIFEELLFRVPLFYFDGNISYFLLSALFSIQHYESNKNIKYNIIYLVYTFILGLMFSNVALLYGLKYSIIMHLITNLSATIGCFARDEKLKLIRKIINHGK